MSRGAIAGVFCLQYGASMASAFSFVSYVWQPCLACHIWPSAFTMTHRLTPQVVENLVLRFESLQQIIRAPKDELVTVDGIGEVLAERVRVCLNLLRSQSAMDIRKDAFHQEL